MCPARGTPTNGGPGPGEGAGDGGEVRDAGLRGMEGCDGGRGRLDVPDPMGRDPGAARHPVGMAAALALGEARQLGLACREDQLAAALVRNTALLAVLV